MGSRAASRSASTLPRRAMIVEFTGAPGSGKSTLASHALEQALARGLRVVERDALLELYLENGLLARLLHAAAPSASYERTRMRIHQRVENPLLLRRFARRFPHGWERFQAELEVLRVETPEELVRIERWVKRGVRQFMMACARSSLVDLVLCDEGIAHRSVNLFARPGSRLEVARLREFLAGWALPDVIVHVRSSQERCAQRAWTRGVPKRLAGRNEAELRDFVAASAAISAEIADEARRRGLPTYEIENEHASSEDLLRSSECGALLAALMASPTVPTRADA